MIVRDISTLFFGLVPGWMAQSSYGVSVIKDHHKQVADHQLFKECLTIKSSRDATPPLEPPMVRTPPLKRKQIPSPPPRYAPRRSTLPPHRAGLTKRTGKMYHGAQNDEWQYIWEEDVFELQSGVTKMGPAQPNCNQTYIMYHGTSLANASKIKMNGFKPSGDGMLGRGVYLSRDMNKASNYPLDLSESERVVLRVKVNVGNVIAINYQDHPRQKTWHDAGYGEVFDTAWCPPNCGMTRSGMEEDCVWDPRRIVVVQSITPRRRRRPQHDLYR